MPSIESVIPELAGRWRDVVRGASGEVRWDSGWRSNAIVGDCRRLLAAFMGNSAGAVGIQGLLVGAGQAAWDLPPGPAPATPAQTATADPDPFLFPVGDLQIDFLQGGTVTGTPTNRIQIVASLGPGVPPWPNGTHPTSTLREFGLAGELDGDLVLINYVTHPAIVKDPASTVERTIWLVF
jgi:hypothetical protein